MHSHLQLEMAKTRKRKAQTPPEPAELEPAELAQPIADKLLGELQPQEVGGKANPVFEEATSKTGCNNR